VLPMSAAPNVLLPPDDAGILALVREVYPMMTSNQQREAVRVLGPHKGEIIEKALVKETIAVVTGRYVSQILWPPGWAKAEWK
jgi:hypothetical protein